jgi:hypothetical protein
MTYRLFADPGHCWLEVSTTELCKLGIQGDISGYSYLDHEKKTAFLEEDCDLEIFLRAKKEKGESVEFREVFQEISSVRNLLPRYRPV